MSDVTGYSTGQKALHWVIALLVIGMVPGGIIMSDNANKAPFDAMFGEGAHAYLYDAHKAVGVIILLLMVLRVLVRLMRGAPPYYPPITAFERSLSAAVHGVLYLLLLAVPLLGWLGVSAYPAPLPFFGLFEVPKLTGPNRELAEFVLSIHGPLGILLGLLGVLHIVAAVYHGLVKRDGVLSRMARGGAGGRRRAEPDRRRRAPRGSGVVAPRPCLRAKR